MNDKAILSSIMWERQSGRLLAISMHKPLAHCMPVAMDSPIIPPVSSSGLPAAGPGWALRPASAVRRGTIANLPNAAFLASGPTPGARYNLGRTEP